MKKHVIVCIEGNVNVFDNIDTAFAFYDFKLFGKSLSDLAQTNYDYILDSQNYIKTIDIIYGDSGIIYCNKIVPTDMSYVGQTIENYNRSLNLRRVGVRYSGVYFEADRLRYIDDIERSVLWVSNNYTEDELNYKETYFILKMQCLFPYGYNDKLCSKFESLYMISEEQYCELLDLCNKFSDRINDDKEHVQKVKDIALKKVLELNNLLVRNYNRFNFSRNNVTEDIKVVKNEVNPPIEIVAEEKPEPLVKDNDKVIKDIDTTVKDGNKEEYKQSNYLANIPYYSSCFKELIIKDYGEFGDLINFCLWITNNRPHSKHLNCDILRLNNEPLSPETCCFLPNKLNRYLHNIQKFHFNTSEMVCNGVNQYDTCIYATNKSENPQYRVTIGSSSDSKMEGIYPSLKDAVVARNEFYIEKIKTLAELYKDDIDNKVYRILINFDVEKIKKLTQIQHYNITAYEIKDILHENEKNHTFRTIQR